MTMTTSLLLLLLFFFFLTCTTVVNANHEVIRNINDLQLDENGKLSRHYLLYPETNNKEACRDLFELPDTYGFIMAAVNNDNDGLSNILFPFISNESDDDSACHAICIERGVDHTLVSDVMPHKRYDSSSTNSQSGIGNVNFDSWFMETCQRVEICLLNYYNSKTPVQVYWIQPEDKLLKLHMQIDYAERNTRCFHSYIGHTFLAIDGDSHVVLKKFTIEYAMVYSFGENPASDDPSRHADFEREIVNTFNEEWKRHDKVQRTFSTLGFAKGRLPNDVFASMGAFYYNNRNHAVREEWQGKGVFVNWWESDASFIQIPWNMRNLWQERLRLLVEEWAGESIEQTVMYGLRQYQTGARLLTHVDRLSTHAVSLIVNVAQGGLMEEWPVEVYDHANRLHEVIMTPGDVVYYESAKCLHGRNRPLKGNNDNAYYVNLFTHYRPTGDSMWYSKSNPENGPKPLLLDDVHGSCHVANHGVNGTMDINAIGKVKCDDVRLGNNLSPALFTATNAQDLEHWWRITSPPHFTGYRADTADAATAASDTETDTMDATDTLSSPNTAAATAQSNDGGEL